MKINNDIFPLNAYDVEIEGCTLGCVLLSANKDEVDNKRKTYSVLEKIMKVLKPSDFYRKEYRVIFETLLDMYRANEPIDNVLLVQWLYKNNKNKEKNPLMKVGGIDGITVLSQKVPTSANVEHYVKIVKQKSQYRQALLKISEMKEKLLYGGDVNEIINHTIQNLTNITTIKNNSIIQLPDIICQDGKSKPIHDSWINTKYVCDNECYEFKLNLLTKRNEVFFNGEVYNKKFNYLVTELLLKCRKYGLKIKRGDLINNLQLIASHNSYSPVCNFLNEAKKRFNGEKINIDKVFNCFEFNDEINQDKYLCKKLFTKWLVSAVAVAHNDNREFSTDGVLILQGPQGIGKTRFLYNLVPNKNWVTDSQFLNPSDKDDILRVSRYWFVELGEIDETIKKEKLNRLKGFLTSKESEVRAPYAFESEVNERRTIFLGTVNDEDFLKDLTGERRFWVIALKKIKKIEIDLYQFWGEVMHLWESGYNYHLNIVEIGQVNAAMEQFKKRTAEEQALMDLLSWEADPKFWQWTTLTDLCIILGFSKSKNRVLGKILKRLQNNVTVLGEASKFIQVCRTASTRLYYLPPLKNPQSQQSYEATLYQFKNGKKCIIS